MNFARTLLAASLLVGTSASADVISEHADSVAVTFYHDNAVATSDLLHPEQNAWVRDSGFAFITETRTIDLPAGPATVKFRDVTSTMVPQTADIQGLPAGVIERNFDYYFLSPGSLLAKSIGETVRLVRTDPKTGKPTEQDAVVRSGPNGAVFEINGKFEALRCSGLPEKLVFDHLPGGLADTPTLSVRTTAPTAGRYTVKLSYIATGLNWSADYIAHILPGTDKLALNGWLTLANFSTTRFPNAPVDVVAGKLQTTGDDQSVKAAPLAFAENCWPMNIDWAKRLALLNSNSISVGTGAPMAIMAAPRQDANETVVVTAEKRIEARQLGDYKLYPLPEPTTVAAQQTKQVQFLDQEDVPFERLYRYDVADDARESDVDAPATVLLRLQNRADAGLGKPLPAGGVSVFEQGTDGLSVFVGQNAIRDMAVGLPVEVETGRAPDVRARPRLIKSETFGKREDRKVKEEWEIAIMNGKPVPITFELRHDLYRGRAEIGAESLGHTSVSGRAVWTATLAPGERTTVRYVITRPD